MKNDLTTHMVFKHDVQTWRRLGAAIVILVLAAMAVTTTQAHARSFTLIAFGDSLTAGYRLPQGKSFADQLEQALKAKNLDVDVINAGVSGDTVSAGLARFDWSVPDDADGIIVQLGANDALRGVDPNVTRKALDQLLEKISSRKLPALIAGMLAPPNLGAAYGETFNAIFPQLAMKHDMLLYPFFLDGVAARPQLNLPDGIHPTVEGVGIIVQNILPHVEQLITRMQTRTAQD